MLCLFVSSLVHLKSIEHLMKSFAMSHGDVSHHTDGFQNKPWTTPLWDYFSGAYGNGELNDLSPRQGWALPVSTRPSERDWSAWDLYERGKKLPLPPCDPQLREIHALQWGLAGCRHTRVWADQNYTAGKCTPNISYEIYCVRSDRRSMILSL